MSVAQIEHAIMEAGFVPQRRTMTYERIGKPGPTVPPLCRPRGAAATAIPTGSIPAGTARSGPAPLAGPEEAKAC
jgi:hypothetical protein